MSFVLLYQFAHSRAENECFNIYYNPVWNYVLGRLHHDQ